MYIDEKENYISDTKMKRLNLDLINEIVKCKKIECHI